MGTTATRSPTIYYDARTSANCSDFSHTVQDFVGVFCNDEQVGFNSVVAANETDIGNQ